jgi:PEGA domain
MPRKNQPGCPCCGNAGNCFAASCVPCNIPKADLTIAWTNVLTGNGSATLKFDGVATWASGCVDNGLQFKLVCGGGGIELRAYFFIDGICPTGQSGYCTNVGGPNLSLVLSSSTCSPFSLTFQCTELGCPSIYAAGNTQFVVSGPNQSFGICPICVCVIGQCGAIPGATVSIGGFGGPTGSNGCVVVDIGTAGSNTITVSAPGYNTYTSTQALKCSQTLSVSLTLSPGNQCCQGCGSSLPQTIQVSDTRYFAGGAQATYYPSISLGIPGAGFGSGQPGWVASAAIPDGITLYDVLFCAGGVGGPYSWEQWIRVVGQGPVPIVGVLLTGGIVLNQCDPFMLVAVSTAANCGIPQYCGIYGVPGQPIAVYPTTTWTL